MARRKRTRPQSEDMSLQITSMADIFVILLVFLLKSYATSATNIAPSATTTLPQADAQDSAVEALKVELAENAVLVEGQPVVQLQKFEFSKDDLLGNGSSKLLGKALERERQRQVLIAKSNSEVKVDPKIVIVADQRAPYGSVKAVLASAALHGYTDFKLAVVRGE